MGHLPNGQSQFNILSSIAQIKDTSLVRIKGNILVKESLGIEAKTITIKG